MEKDMETVNVHTNTIHDIYRSFALVGSKIIADKTLIKINANAKKLIDYKVKKPTTQFNDSQKECIIIAVINYAKKWKCEDNKNFWTYIALQFGYRDENGSAINIVKSCLEDVLKKNKRWFIEGDAGREFKATIVVHAFAPQKTWYDLFDFLFDFYKNNLGWNYSAEDPLISTMVDYLRKKLDVTAAEESVEFNISTKAYSFQQSVWKLVTLRPQYAKELFSKLLAKIDELIKQNKSLPHTYEEVLVEQWFQHKLNTIIQSSNKNVPNYGATSKIVMDYTKIRATYELLSDGNVYISISSIRVYKENWQRARLSIYFENKFIDSFTMSYYGNELGRTLHEQKINISNYLPDTISNFDFRIVIQCDDETLFDSKEDLYREVLIFSNNKEITPFKCQVGNYLVVIPKNALADAVGIEFKELGNAIDEKIHVMAAAFNRGYMLRINGILMTVDNSTSANDINVLFPVMKDKVKWRFQGEIYEVVTSHDSIDIIYSDESISSQYVVLVDGQRVDIRLLPSYMCKAKKIFNFRLADHLDNNIGQFQVLDIANNKMIFDRKILVVDELSVTFNQKFYFADNDFIDAYCIFKTREQQEKKALFSQYDNIEFSYKQGKMIIEIPKITISCRHQIITPKEAMWIGEIPQDTVWNINADESFKIKMYANNDEIVINNDRQITLGNYIHSLNSNNSAIELELLIRGESEEKRYQLGKVFLKENFLRQPRIWSDENIIFWDCGSQFIGNKNTKLSLGLKMDDSEEMSMPLSLDHSEVGNLLNMELGEYEYKIYMEETNLFTKAHKRMICQGKCILGDEETIRFRKCHILIDTITDEIDGNIEIIPCYIDNIEFIAKEYTAAEQGIYPIYRGTMYYVDAYGRRREFSFDSMKNKNGKELYSVNPVRIVYINEDVISITNQEKDGLYYYYYFDKYDRERKYLITDYEPSEQNKRFYSIADLYRYRKETIQNV